MLRSLTILVALATWLVAVDATAVDTWTTPHPGIRLLTRTTNAPLRAYVAEVNLCAAGVSLRVTKPDERRQRPSTFGQSVGAELAVNGDFFSFSTYSTSGLSVGDGEHWSGTGDNGSSSVVAFGYDRVELPDQGVRVSPQAWMNDVIGGHPQVLSAGQVLPDAGTLCTARHPRTGAGLSEDGRTLYVAVVDGRSTSSRGMLCSELGSLLKELGAHQGLNLDGGGSSAMWVRGQGIVSRPSDGTERIVANHLAVIADGQGLPESCNEGWHDAAEQVPTWEASHATTDVDGDGVHEVCARSSAGVDCYAFGPDGPVRFTGPRLSDDTGWGDPSNYNTIRWGDVDGNGLADFCARANDRVYCWLSDGTAFPDRIEGPELADSVGWAGPQYHTTMRLADFTGDGRDDICVRTAAELRCYPSTGTGFAAPIVGPAMPGGDGWDRPSRFGTLRTGDIDGDGAADICGRRASGMVCWPSQRDAFGAEIEGPAWSNASGWTNRRFWSTIRLVDIDGDGRDDLCARAAAGIVCHLSTGTGFGDAIDGPTWSDATGWADPENFTTIRFGDIDGDGDRDVCARGDAGIVCQRWDGAGFGMPITGPTLSDDSGWGAPWHARTFRLVDFDGDRDADVCARAGAGWRCWPSTGDGFDAAVSGPEWSNANGWAGLPYWTSIATGEPRCRPTPETCNDLDDDCDGLVDEDNVCPIAGDTGGTGSPDLGSGGGGSDMGTTPPTGDTGGAPGDVGRDTGGTTISATNGGCGCGSTPGGEMTLWLVIVGLFTFGSRRSKRADRRLEDCGTTDLGATVTAAG